MVQPISLLMSQFNVENSAQLTRSALAAAQETGQGQEVVRDSLRRTQMVQANEAAKRFFQFFFIVLSPLRKLKYGENATKTQVLTYSPSLAETPHK